MASFKIPRGKTYTFSITVLEKNSYLPKDISSLNLGSSSFSLVKLDDLSLVTGDITITKIADDKLAPSDPTTYNNGRLSITIPSVITSTLAYERGPKVDGYYVLPTYEGVVTLKFDNGSSDITAVVPDICVIPTGA